jgi:hypothetical protein
MTEAKPGLRKNEFDALPMLETDRFKITVTDQRNRSCGFVAHIEVNTSQGWQKFDAALGFESAAEALLGGQRVLALLLSDNLAYLNVTAEEIESLA